MVPEATAPLADAQWRDDWYRFARVLNSPNFGPRPSGSTVDLIVLHSISLPPGCYGGDGVQRLFTNTLDWGEHPYYSEIRGLTVSAHFFVQRDGALWQFVGCDKRAWHAGASSHRGQENCNDYSVGIELEGMEGEPFESAQYETLTVVCAALAQRYGLSAVAGHEHIAPGRKGDPGSGFDWTRLQQGLGWSDQCFPEHVRAVSGLSC